MHRINCRALLFWFLTGIALPGAAQPILPGTMPFFGSAPLGVSVQPLAFEQLAQLGLQYGVQVVTTVPNSAADRAGIQEGDIILELNSQAVYSPARLRWLAQLATRDGKATIRYQRDGRISDAEIVLAQPPQPQAPDRRSFEYSDAAPRSYLGIRMQPLTDDLRTVFGAPAAVGVLVSAVEKDTPAAKAGIAAGDVIVRMDRKTIYGINDVHRVVRYFDPGDTLEVEVIRNKERQVLQVSLGEAPVPDSPTYGKDWRQFFDENIPPPELWLRGLEDFMQEWQDYWRDFRHHEPAPAPHNNRML